jgi:hypothetical protein
MTFADFVFGILGGIFLIHFGLFIIGLFVAPFALVAEHRRRQGLQ